MKADAARAMLRDADGQSDQLLVFGTDRALCHRSFGELPKALHGFGLRFTKWAERLVDVLNQTRMIKRTHKVSFKFSYQILGLVTLKAIAIAQA